MSAQSKVSSLFPLLLSIFVDSIGWGIVFPIFDTLLLGNHMHLLPATLSIHTRNIVFESLIAIYCFGMFFGSPILGSLSDRFGRKRMLVFSLLGAALGFLICAYGVSVHNLWLLFAGRLVSGLTAGNFAIAQAAITDMSTPETTPSRIGYLVLSNGLGFSLGPVMGALLINYHPLLIVALMIVITAIMLAATFNESFTFQGQSVMGVGATIKTYVDSFFGKKVRLLFTSLLFYMVAYTLFFTNLPYFLKARFMEGGTSTGYMLTYFAIIFTIGLLVVLPRLTKRFSLQSIVLVSLWVQIVFYAVFYSMTHQVTVLLVLVPIAISVPFIYVSFVSLISGRTEQANQGKVMGAVGSVIAIAWGVGPIAAGFLASMRILDVFAVAIALMVIALCFLIVFMKKNHEVA